MILILKTINGDFTKMKTLLTATITTVLCLLTSSLSAQLTMSATFLNQGDYSVETLDDGLYYLFTLSQAATVPIELNITWNSGSATVGVDFSGNNEYSFDTFNFFNGNNIIIPAGVTSMIFVVDLYDDGSYAGEGVESGSVTITAINAPIQNPVITKTFSIFDFLDPNLDGSKSINDFDAVLSVLGFSAFNFRHMDFNQNGRIDLGDLEGMISIPSPGFNTRMGDANFDGKVDVADLNVVGINWNTFGNSWADGDFDGDGFVGTSDLNYIGQNWGFGT